MQQEETTAMVPIADLEKGRAVARCEGIIVAKEPARFIRDGMFKGLRSVAILRDPTGEVRVTLWEAEASEVELGDRIAIINGWVQEHQGDRVLSAGRFGRISVWPFQG